MPRPLHRVAAPAPSVSAGNSLRPMLRELMATSGVREIMERRGPLGMMALHGGLEERTYEMAAETAAGCGASLYAVVLPANLKWHVPSVLFDPRQSAAMTSFLRWVSAAVSLHGFGRPGYEGVVLLGGRNRSLARRLASAMSVHTELRIISELDAIPADLRGVNPANPVNLPSGGGVQVELSPQAREPETRNGVVAALREFATAEQRSLCVTAGS